MVRHPGAQAAESRRSKKWIETAEGWARACLLYNKTRVLPPKGSLREALFLTVELKRQEAEVFKTRVLAQGIVNLSQDGAKETAEVFKKYVAAALPFMSKGQEVSDQKLKKELKEWTNRGVITFEAPQSNPLAARVKSMQLSGEFRDKLSKARGKRNADV